MARFKPAEQIESIEFSKDSVFSGQNVRFRPFTIVCGMHGSGKSALLGYVASCLYKGILHPDRPPFYENRISRGDRPVIRGTCHVRVRRDESEISYSTGPGREGEDYGSPAALTDSIGEIHPRFLDPSELASEIGIFFQDFDLRYFDLISEDPQVQDRRDLEALRDILGVSYEEVIYFPVVVDPEYSVEWPYVKAKLKGEWIDSHQMSYGELCVHFIRWVLKNPWGGPVVLDEPEANIAHRGHAALLDEIARLARSSKTQVILATHSLSFLERVPLSWVLMCVRSELNPVIVEPSRISDLRDTLGIENPLRALVVVEDEIANLTLQLILGAHGFPLSSNVEIIEAGSWVDVVRTVKILSSSSRVAAVAIIDGDQSDKVSPEDCVLALPGSGPPEKVLFENALLFTSEFAAKLGLSEASTRVYLSELLGLDHHQWLERLSRRTGQDRGYCLRVAFEIWHSNSENKAECEILARGIERIVSG
ncbi:AAA family ATPase [Nocardiopsis sp. FIRDI 009]|uniref:AAA family ATPase n=1 Tax=Nocardiopsis sp. FIRDI 009 TaxID=714197 RepID=UPI0013001E41|nr:hypothetical protein [Nocardiopsis sp. FIRDI 009]